MVVINPEKYEQNLGDLGMQEALRKLHDEISKILKVYEEKVNQERYFLFLVFLVVFLVYNN